MPSWSILVAGHKCNRLGLNLELVATASTSIYSLQTLPIIQPRPQTNKLGLQLSDPSS
jgi:hypothetical protein